MITSTHARSVVRRAFVALVALFAMSVGVPLMAGHASAVNTYTLTLDATRIGGVYLSFDPAISSVLTLICPPTWDETQCNVTGNLMPAGSYGYYRNGGSGSFAGFPYAPGNSVMYANGAPLNWVFGSNNTALPTGEFEFRVIDTSTWATSNLATITLTDGVPIELSTTGVGDLSWSEDLTLVEVRICDDTETTAAGCEQNQLYWYAAEAADASRTLQFDTATEVHDSADNAAATLEAKSYGFVIFGSLNGAAAPRSNLVHSTVPAAPAPDAPTALVSTAGDRSAAVTFTPGAGNGSPITSYEYTIDKGHTVSFFDPAVTQLAVTGLTNGVTYSLKIRAVSTAGNGAWSTAVTLAPVVGALPAATHVAISCVDSVNAWPQVTVMQGADLVLEGDQCDDAYNSDWTDWSGQDSFSSWPGFPSAGEYQGVGPFTWTVATDAAVGPIDELYFPYVGSYDNETGQTVEVTIVQSPAPLVELDSYAPSTATGGTLTYTVDDNGPVSTFAVGWDDAFGQGSDWTNLPSGACPSSFAVLVDGTPVDLDGCGGGADEGMNFWEGSLLSEVPAGAVITLSWDSSLLTTPASGGVTWVGVDQTVRTPVPVKIVGSAGAIDLALNFVVGANITAGGLGVNIEGSNLEPGSTVEGVLRSTPTVIGSGTVAGDGTFSGLFHLPANTPAGAHSITVSGHDADGVAFSVVAWFSVDSHGLVTALSFVAPTLPPTGSALMPIVAIAILLLLVGMHCLTFVRRERAM